MANNKIGKIELTDVQREVLASGKETEFFRILSDVVRPQQQVKIALELINGPISIERQTEQRGRSAEWDTIVRFIENVAKDFHKNPDTAETDEDGDGIDTEV